MSMGQVKRLLILWSALALLSFNSYAQMGMEDLVPAPPPPDSGANWSVTEYAFVRANGEIDGLPPAMALRLGVSSFFVIPIHSSIELGVIGGDDRRRHVRLNIISVGKQPQLTRLGRAELWAADPYVRGDIGALIWAEGGQFSYAPGLELGMSFRFSENFAIAPGVRLGSINGHLFEKNDTSIAAILSLIEVVRIGD